MLENAKAQEFIFCAYFKAQENPRFSASNIINFSKITLEVRG